MNQSVKSLPSAADVILDTLSAYGVDDIFSSPGSEWVPVWEALARRRLERVAGPNFWNCRHEALVFAAATGYSKVTQRLSAALVHASVGPLNGAMALRSAYHEGVPLVTVAADSTTLGQGDSALQFAPAARWLRHLSDVGGPARMVEPFVKWSDTASTLEALPAMLQHACRIALAPPQGPVFLTLAVEALVATEVSQSWIPRCAPAASAGVPDASLLDEVAERLLSSSLPFVITEYAGREPEAVAELVALAEALVLPVVEASSPVYMNFPRDHALHFGYEGRTALEQADCLLLLGVRGPWSPLSAGNDFPGTIILADSDPTKSHLQAWGYSGDITVAGSIQAIVRGLRERVEARLATSDEAREKVELRRQQISPHRLRYDSSAAPRSIDDGERESLNRLCVSLGRVLPEDAILVPETASVTTSILQHVPQRIPGTFFGRMTGGLGVGMGTALGVQLAARDRLVVSLIGDGTLNYNPALAAFGFAQEYRLPVIFVITTNGAYTSMHEDLKRFFPNGSAIQSGICLGSPIEPVPDYSRLASIFGGYGEQIVGREGIEGAVERAIKAARSGTFAVLDFHI